MEEHEARAGASNVESDDDEIVDMGEMIGLQDKAMEEVAAVLGAGDDLHCSYNEGYMKRQALYACVTCCVPDGGEVDPSKLAGICLACSYHCHESHNLIELYTKRNFRCDCGNKKFKGVACNLQPDKDDYNNDNKYNQNFKGLYCVCATPYPNPEDPIEDEMLQCIICEDWYHSRHLGVPVPSNYAEMICINCIKNHEFLLHYDGLTITSVTAGDSNTVINIDGTDETQSSSVNGDEVKAVKEEESNCKKPKTASQNLTAKFMENEKWRQMLCTCTDCMQMYENEQVSFLLDPQDTVHTYEEKGKANVKEFNDKLIEKQEDFLNSMERAPLMELLASYNDFKEQLLEYLKKFAENKKVIRVEDVQEFFAQLNSRKRQKLDMQYYCR